MDALSMLFDGFVAVLQPENLLYLVGGVLVGVILGAIPGLSATMAMALAILLSSYLPPTQCPIMLLAAYDAAPSAALCRPSPAAPPARFPRRPP